MLISITEVGKKIRRRENNTEQPRPRHGDPYENKIQPKWIWCNWFQIVRSGERRYRQLLCEMNRETRMFTQAFLFYINRHAEITGEEEKEKVRRGWQKEGEREKTENKKPHPFTPHLQLPPQSPSSIQNYSSIQNWVISYSHHSTPL